MDTVGSRGSAILGHAHPGPSWPFNAGLRRNTAVNGALLILDEVLTGFRVGPAGLATLRLADEGVYARLDVVARTLCREIGAALDAVGRVVNALPEAASAAASALRS